MAQGTIKKLVSERGFGFIQLEGAQDSGKDLFFHRNDVQGMGYVALREGDRVTYDEATELLADAIADWKYDQREKQRETKEREDQTESQRKKHGETQKTRMDSARGKYEDFDDVALSERLPLNQATVDFVQRRELGYEVLYHLGQNLEDALKIAKLDADDTIVELRAIERKLQAPVKTSTSAPPPPSKVGGTKPSTDPIQAAANRGDWKEYNRLMNAKEIAKKKK